MLLARDDVGEIIGCPAAAAAGLPAAAAACGIPLIAVCTVEADSVVKKLLSLISELTLSSSSSLLAVSMAPFIGPRSPPAPAAAAASAAVGAAMGAAEMDVDADCDDTSKPGADVNDEDASDKKARLLRAAR